MKLRVLDLFSGIGGFSLGLERAGMETVAFCEIDPYCRKVLAKHWPGVPCYDDIRTLSGERLAADGIAADVVAGGFPCQDISSAGKGAGINGERSGLWAEMARVIGEVRPRYVVVENVSALLVRGLGRVIGDLDALGYVGEWHCIPAAAVGAPHRRDRIWIVAYPQHPDADGTGPYRAAEHVNGEAEPADQQVGEPGPLRPLLAHSARDEQGRQEQRAERERAGLCGQPEFRHADGEGQPASAVDDEMAGLRGNVADAQGDRRQSWRSQPILAREAGWLAGNDWWLVEPAVGRVAHGIPARVDRLRSLGNAVVPQIPELIGRAIVGAQ